MTGFLAHCVRCGRDFETPDAYGNHLNECSQATGWKEPRFKEVDATILEFPPSWRYGTSTFDETEDARLAPDTQRERVDGALRSGRIAAEQWPLTDDDQPGFWRRIWRSITSK